MLYLGVSDMLLGRHDQNDYTRINLTRSMASFCLKGFGNWKDNNVFTAVFAVIDHSTPGIVRALNTPYSSPAERKR